MTNRGSKRTSEEMLDIDGEEAGTLTLNLSHKTSKKKKRKKNKNIKTNNNLNSAMKQRKGINKKKVKKVDFEDLTPQSEWDEFDVDFYLFRETTYHNFKKNLDNISYFGIINVKEMKNDEENEKTEENENTNNKQNDGQPDDKKQKKTVKTGLEVIKITATSTSGFDVGKYELKEWYNIKGAKIAVYNAKKIGILSSASTFTPIKKNAAPDFNKLLKKPNILTNFKQIISQTDSLLALQYVKGHVYNFKIGGNHLETTVLDADKNLMIFKDWGVKQIPDVKLGTLVLYSQIKKEKKYSKTICTSTGCTFYYPSSKTDLSKIEVQHDLSSIDFDQEFDKAKELSMKQIIVGRDEGGYGKNAFFKVCNCGIDTISGLFKLTDENGQKLHQTLTKSEVCEENTGIRRGLFDTDNITYFIGFLVKDNETQQQIRMNGFNECGERLFSKNAKTLYKNYDITDIERLTQQITQIKCDLLLTFYSKPRGGGNYWTVANVFIADEEEEEEEDEDVDISDENP